MGLSPHRSRKYVFKRGLAQTFFVSLQFEFG